MAESKFDFDALKKEVEDRQQTAISEGRAPSGKNDKSFLISLLNSVDNKTADNTAVKKITSIVEASNNFSEVKVKLDSQGHAAQQQTTNVPSRGANYEAERGDFGGPVNIAEMMKSRREQAGQPPQYNTNNGALSQVLTEGTRQTGNGAGMNSVVLNEQIKAQIGEILTPATFDKIVADSFKNVLTELFSKEKITEVIREMILEGKFKKVILDTVVEAQEASKKKRLEEEAKRKAGF